MTRYTTSGTVNSVQQINAELVKIQEAQKEFLARDGQAPNEMKDELDMNSNRIINLPKPITPTEPLRLEDLSNFKVGEASEFFVTLEQFNTEAGTGGDDTDAFEQACAASESTGKPVLLLDKTYSLEPQPWNNGTPHYTVAGIEGIGSPVLKARSRKPSSPAIWAMLSVAFSEKGAVLKNFTVDPDLSPDPVEWTSQNFNDFWQGSRAIYIQEQKDFSIENVHTLSSVRAGIAILDCDNFTLDRCSTKRSRNSFGDGFYITGRNFAVSRCDAFDCTRIGFVVEAIAETSQSTDFTFKDCTAEFCHDNSIAYGGTEFNAGFWYENFSHGVTINCTAKNCGDRGFTTAHSVRDEFQSEFTDEMVFTSKYISCRVDGAVNGFSNSNLDPSIIKSSVVLEQCTAVNVTRFLQTARGQENRAFLAAKNCHAVIPSTSNTATGFMHLGGELVIENCTLRFDNFDSTKWNDMSSDYGAVSRFSTDAGHSLKIDNLRVFTSTSNEIPVMLKQNSATSRERTKVEVQNTWLLQNEMRVKTARFENVTFEKIGTTVADETYYNDCKILGVYGVGLARKPIFGINGGVTRLNNCTLDFQDSGDYLYLWNESKTDGSPALTVNNCTFIKDVTSDGFMIRVNCKTEIKNTPDIHNFEISNCRFINTGASTTNPIISSDLDELSNGTVYGVGNYKSDTLTVDTTGDITANF